MSNSKNSQKGLFEILRSCLYAVSLTCGIYIAVYELHDFGNKGTFFAFSLGLLGIFLIEIFLNWYVNTKDTKVIGEFEEELRKEARHIFYLITLPVVLYVSLVGFSYYNLSSKIFYLALFFCFVTFYLFFKNIKVYFDDRKDNDEKMDSILDILKFVIFFANINTFSYLYQNSEEFVAVLGAFILSFLIMTMILWRMERVHKRTMVYNLISSIFISIVFLALNTITDITSSGVTLMMILLFYILIAILHHRIKKTLDRTVVLEYVLVLLALSSVIYGVS